MYRLSTILVVLFFQGAPPVSAQAVDRAEAGEILLQGGVDGLKQMLASAGAPALTFDQEIQIRNLYDVYRRESERLVASFESAPASVRRTLADQLLLAAAKFLNPVQRDALGALADTDINSDLPTDPNELREYLRDLASPAASGEQNVVIDGFSGGRMPNRDEIMEIRINDNAFTAEQRFQGRGRTEIRTRGGTGQFNGDAEFEFEDESLDARNAFAASRPPYQTRDLRLNLSGPVIRNRMTVTFGFGREVSEQGDTLRAVTPRGLISDAITRPTYERGLSLRSTMQLNENHALTFSFSHETERSENDGVGGFSLPEQGSRQITRDMSFQIQQTSVLTPKINNEVRLQIGAESDETVPLSSQPHIVVPDAFRGGGSTERGSSADREIGFGNLLMYTGESISIKTGFDGSYQMDGSDSRNNFNGTFTFGSLEDYLAGRPLQYSVNQGDPLLDIRQFEWAGFLQTDFRVTPRWTMGFGIRYEAQTNLEDRNNIDPRFGFAYHLGGATVLRGGTGVFHERVPVWQFQNLLRFDGERQRTVIIRNPSFPDPFQEGEQTVQVPSSVRARSDDLAAPYTWNSEASIETTLAIGLILTGSYQFVRGVHLIRGRNVNAPMDVASPVPRSCSPDQAEQACVRPQPDRGNIVEMESTGLSSTQEIRAGFQQRLRFINIRGNYTARFAYSNTSGPFDLPADNYDMSSEWGPVSPRHSVNTSLNLRLPWTVDADMMFNWNSGEPYSIVTGRDDNRDTNTTDRPAGVHRNSLWGPSFFEMDMNLSKTLSLFPEPAEETGPLAGGGYFGRRTGSRVTFSAEVRNLLNTVNYDRISGVITSPFFRMPTRARDGRSVSLSVRFDF